MPANLIVAIGQKNLIRPDRYDFVNYSKLACGRCFVLEFKHIFSCHASVDITEKAVLINSNPETS